MGHDRLFNLLYNMQNKAAKTWANGHHLSAMTQLFILFVGNEFIDSLIRGRILNDDSVNLTEGSFT